MLLLFGLSSLVFGKSLPWILRFLIANSAFQLFRPLFPQLNLPFMRFPRLDRLLAPDALVLGRNDAHIEGINRRLLDTLPILLSFGHFTY